MEEVKQENELGTENVGKLLFRLSLPAITAQVINVLYNMVDRMYIGHIPKVGAAALTGVGVTMPVIMAITAFAYFISMGGAPRASIMLGKGKEETAEMILGNCTVMMAALSLLLTVIFQLTGRQILMMFGASENTIGYAWDYMKIYSLGTIFVQLALGLNAFITAQGYAKTSMYTVLIGAVLNILLDPVFIFVLNMGVKGAALATILSQAVSSVWVVRFLTSEKSRLRIRKRGLKLKGEIILPCMALGLSPFIMAFTESILSVCFNSSLLKYGGDLAVGAMTILSSVMQFSMLPLQGLTQGAQPIVSFNYGAGSASRVKQVFRILLLGSVSYSTVLWGLAMFFPGLFIHIFTNDVQLASYTEWAIRIYMAASLVFGAQVACQQTFIALGNAKASVFLALLRKVFLLIPLIFLLPGFVRNQSMGVFLAEPIADCIAVSVTVSLFLVSFKNVIRKMEENSYESNL